MTENTRHFEAMVRGLLDKRQKPLFINHLVISPNGGQELLYLISATRNRRPLAKLSALIFTIKPNMLEE